MEQWWWVRGSGHCPPRFPGEDTKAVLARIGRFMIGSQRCSTWREIVNAFYFQILLVRSGVCIKDESLRLLVPRLSGAGETPMAALFT